MELGSDRLDELLTAATTATVSVISAVEVVSALCRLRREGVFDDSRYEEAKQSFLADLGAMNLVAVNEAITDRALEILERWPLRGCDSLHVASAMERAADRFVSADRRQCEAARGEGLAVEELPGG